MMTAFSPTSSVSSETSNTKVSSRSSDSSSNSSVIKGTPSRFSFFGRFGAKVENMSKEKQQSGFAVLDSSDRSTSSTIDDMQSLEGVVVETVSTPQKNGGGVQPTRTSTRRSSTKESWFLPFLRIPARESSNRALGDTNGTNKAELLILGEIDKMIDHKSDEEARQLLRSMVVDLLKETDKLRRRLVKCEEESKQLREDRDEIRSQYRNTLRSLLEGLETAADRGFVSSTVEKEHQHRNQQQRAKETTTPAAPPTSTVASAKAVALRAVALAGSSLSAVSHGRFASKQEEKEEKQNHEKAAGEAVKALVAMLEHMNAENCQALNEKLKLMEQMDDMKSDAEAKVHKIDVLEKHVKELNIKIARLQSNLAKPLVEAPVASTALPASTARGLGGKSLSFQSTSSSWRTAQVEMV